MFNANISASFEISVHYVVHSPNVYNWKLCFDEKVDTWNMTELMVALGLKLINSVTPTFPSLKPVAREDGIKKDVKVI